jgi:tetratricopeptide (TPR) repeat protein
LVEDELVQPRVNSRFRDEEEYAFRHILLRDAAYAGLTERDRRLGHQLAGDWLERQGESDVAVLAEHFDRAGERARAGDAWQRGVEQALGAHDFEAAIARAERALASGLEGARAGAMRLAQAEAHRWLGRFRDAREAAAEAIAGLSERTTAWYRGVEELLTASGRLGSFEEASSWVTKLAGQPAPGATSAQMSALCCAARVLFQAGDYPGADELLVRIQAIVESGVTIRRRALAEYHRLRGARARHVGDVAGDFEGYLAALSACEIGDERQACNARVSLGFSYIELGDHAAARSELVQALAAADRMRLSSIASRARQNLALVHAAEGDWSEARRLCSQVIEESVAQGNLRFEGWTRIYLSRIEQARGDGAAAEREALLAAERTEVTPPARAGALAALALARLELGQPREALDAALGALDILAAFGGIEEFEALVRRAHAEALLASGLVDQASRALDRARARLHQLAARIARPAHRKSFLARVPDNARLLELAARHGRPWDPADARVELAPLGRVIEAEEHADGD